MSLRVGTYTASFLPTSTLHRSPQRLGVDVGRVALVSSGPLAAIVGAFSLDDFDEEPLRRNLEAPAWLEDKARAHDRVLGGAVGAAPLVPLRFGTVYRDEDGVRRMLEERGVELVASRSGWTGASSSESKHFSRTRGEGRFRLGVDGPRVFAPEAAGSSAPAADMAETVRERTQLVHEQLSAISDDARANAPQPPELSGRREKMLLNGAYLVRAECHERFAEAVEALRQEVGREGIELAPDRAVAALQLRRAGRRRMTSDLPLAEQVTLIELVDRVLNKGVVIAGDITLAVADVDLVYLGLRVLLTSAATLDRLRSNRADALPVRARRADGGVAGRRRLV